MAQTATPPSAPTSDPPATRRPIQRAAGLAHHEISGWMLGPDTYLADEAERLAALRWDWFTVTQLAPTIGAEVTGVDLASIDDATMDALVEALVAYKVVVLRGQHIDADAQIALSRRLGDPEVHPFLEGDDERPEIVRLVKDERTGGYENIWHSDVSWREVPAAITILRAIDVPPVGGDTLFADMTAAYAGLDETTRERIDGRSAIHDFSQSFGQGLSPDQLAESRVKHPPVEHPIVRRHPVSGAPILYVNRIFTDRIVGLDETESDLLLATLYRQSERPEHQCRVRWEPDTVVIWDNRATQHYACSDYWPNRRVMERTAITGERPVGLPVS